MTQWEDRRSRGMGGALVRVSYFSLAPVPPLNQLAVDDHSAELGT